MVMWNSNVDALLFKNIIKLHDIKPNYPKLEEAMRGDGVDVTAKAITHRIAKLRTAINEEVDPKATPLGKPVIKHRKVNGVGEKRPAPKEEVKAKAVVDDGDFFDPKPSDAEDEQPPAKKAKTTKKAVAKVPKSKTIIKSEDEEEEGGDAI